MRPHRIQVSSSRWDRLEEAEELDTSEEPLLRREPLIDRMDLESASSNLRPERVDQDEELPLHAVVIDDSDNSYRIIAVSHPRLRSCWLQNSPVLLLQFRQQLQFIGTQVLRVCWGQRRCRERCIVRGGVGAEHRASC